MLVASFLTALPLVTGGTPFVVNALRDDADAQVVATELRVYDVRALVELEASGDELEVTRNILPLMHVVAKETDGGGGFQRSSEAVDRLLNLFMSVDWDDNWSIESVGRGEIHLNATRDAHQRLARLIEAFESASFDTTAVIVQYYEGPLTLPSGLVGRDNLATALSSAGIEASSQGLGLHPRKLATLRNTSAHTAALMVECEIAQRAVVHYARTYEILSGLELEMTGSLTRRGVRLGYVIRDTRPGETTDSEPVECKTRIGTEHGPVVDRSAEWNESIELRGGGVFGQVTLTPQEALVFRVSTRGDVASYCAVSLDLATRTTASVAAIELGEEYVAEIAQAGACRSLRVDAHGRALQRHLATLGQPSDDIVAGDSGEAPVLGVEISTDTSERFERIAGQFDFVERFDVGASAILVVHAADKGVMDRLLDIEDQLAAPRLSIDVTARHSGSPVLHATTIVDGGAQAAIAVGAERLEAQEYDVEVAQSASAHRPSVRTRFDGVALAIKLHPLSNGRLAFRVLGQFATPTNRETSNANQVEGSGLVATDTDRLLLDERGVAQAVGDGVWRIVLGDRSGRGSSVTLDIRATR